MIQKKIKWGTYLRREWFEFTTLQDPILQPVLDRLRQLDWGEYQPWIVGSVLTDKPTMDLDLVFKGPYQQDNINRLLQQVVKISFDTGVFIDVKYLVLGEIVNIETFLQSTDRHKMHFALPYEFITINDKKHRSARRVDGLFRTTLNLPFPKDRGRQHFDPVFLLA